MSASRFALRNISSGCDDAERPFTAVALGYCTIGSQNLGSVLQNYTDDFASRHGVCLGKQRKYPPRFEDGYTTSENPKHCITVG